MTRKPKYAVIALNDNVDVGSFFNLLMTNGYPNVTFLTNLAEHAEVKKLINGTTPKTTQAKEKASPRAIIPAPVVEMRLKSAEFASPAVTATATVNVTPSTSLLPPLFADLEARNDKLGVDPNNIIHCRLCDNKIMCTRLSNLTNHVRRHSSVKQYSCIYCPYQHNEMSKVRTHMSSQHGDAITTPNDNLTPELQKIWCAYMEKCFPGYLDSQGKTGRSALEVFGGRSLAKLEEMGMSNGLLEEGEPPLTEKLHNCIECGDAIAGDGSVDFRPYTEHIRNKHAEYCAPYKCGECNFMAAYEYIVRGHIASEHAIIAADVDVHQQPVCDMYGLFVGKFFPSLDDIVPDMTEELKALVDQAAKSDDSLSDSLKYEAVPAELLLGPDSGNENTEPILEGGQIECKLCSQVFNVADLTHIMAHSKEHYYLKQFECPSCSYASNNFGEVRQHLHTDHLGEGTVTDLKSDILEEAWMQTMKRCFPDIGQKHREQLTKNLKSFTVEADLKIQTRKRARPSK